MRCKANVAHEAKSSNDGKLEGLLDSATKLSSLQQQPTDCTAWFTNPITVATANGALRVKKNYALATILPTGATVMANAYSLRNIRQNHFSVGDFTSHCRPLLVEKTGAFLKPQQFSQIIKSTVQLAKN